MVQIAEKERVLSPLPAGSLALRVAEHLRRAICTGKLEPGERIVELRVARLLGVGQSTAGVGGLFMISALLLFLERPCAWLDRRSSRARNRRR